MTGLADTSDHIYSMRSICSNFGNHPMPKPTLDDHTCALAREISRIEAILDREKALPRSQAGEIRYAVMAGAVGVLDRAKEHARDVGETERIRAASEGHSEDNCRSLGYSAEMTTVKALLGERKAWDWIKRWGLDEGGWA